MKTIDIAKSEFSKNLFYNKIKNLDKYDWQDLNNDYVKHYHKWEFFNYSKNFGNFPKQGNFFLYEIVKNNTVSYPRVGIYINSMVCDQTLEIEWIDYKRTIDDKEFEFQFEWNNKIHSDTTSISQQPTEIRSIILWSDSMLVYGGWQSLPDWKSLRRAYENTWWFHKSKDVMRNNKINLFI